MFFTDFSWHVTATESSATLRHWDDVTLLPVYLSSVSLLLLLVPVIRRTIPAQFPLCRDATTDSQNVRKLNDRTSSAALNTPAVNCGVWGVFSMRSRLVACICLLSLAAGTADVPQSLFYIYTIFLALAVLLLGKHTPRIVGAAKRHLAVLLLTAFAVSVYLDVWPLAQYKPLPPTTELPTWFIWTRFTLLLHAAVLVPLLLPRVYIPVNPQNPLPPSPEQTASLFSLLFFTHLDPLVYAASRRPHLPYDELPPLADVDHSAYLRARAFPLLDPMQRKSREHVFFALIRVYAAYFFRLTVSIVICCLTGFIVPIALYQLLYFVETGGEGASIKPWFWIGALFFKSIMGSVSNHWYYYEATKLLVRTEGIITQLVFEHALRIRLAADSEESGDTSPIHDPTSDPQGPSLAPAAAAKVPNSTGEARRKGSSLIGKINNLVSSDLDNLTEGRDLPYVVVYIPLKMALSVWFLYAVLGWSAFVGFALMTVGFYAPDGISGFLASRIHTVQVERMKRTDERVESITEVVGQLRLVKMLGWESRMEGKLCESRNRELHFIRKYNLYNLLNSAVTWNLPLIAMLSTYATYTVIMKQPLSASKVFSSLGVLESLRESMFMVLQYVPKLVTAKVSLDRVNDYLCNTELLDGFSKEAKPDSTSDLHTAGAVDLGKIGFNNARFAWSSVYSRVDEFLAPRRVFHLDIKGEVTFIPGNLNLIVGPTASGKSSLLLALLGELHFEPSGSDSWYNLPRKGGVSYCAQESWIMNQTIKDNILFGQPFDGERYNEVLYARLWKIIDLGLFEAGDATEVGERGLTLSGGQKARVSLARAVYSNSAIVLLDDVLSALDVHTVKWIVDKCISGKLLRGRTVILVTHNVSLIRHLARRIVSLSSRGEVSVIDDPETRTEDLQVKEEESVPSKGEMDGAVDLDNKCLPIRDALKGKLIIDEDVSLGHVGVSAMLLYLRGMGGFFFWGAFLVTCAGTELIDLFQRWWIGRWAAAYTNRLPQEVSVAFYLGIYTAAVLGGAAVGSLGQFVWISGIIRAARSIHETLIRTVLGTTLRFLDRTPVGRIIQRFTKDVAAVDTTLSRTTHNTIQWTLHLIQMLITIVLFSPPFLVPGVMLLLLGSIIGQLYIRAQLPVKREMSNSRAPVFSHFGASINGLTSIRAYGAEEAFKDESLRRIDRYTRTARPFWNLSRWIGLRVDFIGSLFSTSLAGYLVYYSHSPASDIGFLLNCSLWLTELLLWWIRELNEVEVQGNSLERIQQYVEIEQEDVPTEAGKPPAYWPTSGRLSVEKLSARHTVDGPDVLHDLTFECQSGDKIGIVGRTGSGKSSLTLSLLRLIPTSGEVYFDGLPTSKMNLDSLRGAITIIPQQPELMSGSIRENLDPFGEHEDVELNDALRSAGLFKLQEDLVEEERVSLDTMVSSSGGNFSLGQRQIIALARALVRRSRVLILDEATASMDHKTDALIQVSLRTQFKDCTVITIAHRLHTIMDSDKVLVLDSGHLEEYDSPRNLLAKKSGTFKAMVDGSSDRDALYALAA